MNIPGGFKRPFKLDSFGTFIWDAENNMAADFVNRRFSKSTEAPHFTGEVRARGWGRIQYQEDPDSTMDAWEAWVAARGAGTRSPEEILHRLNNDCAADMMGDYCRLHAGHEGDHITASGCRFL